MRAIARREGRLERLVETAAQRDVPERASFSAHGLGDYERALRHGRAALDAFAEINHPWGMTLSLCRIGFALVELGELDQARRTFDEALTRARAASLPVLAALAVIGHGVVLSRAGETEGAASILLAALALEGLPSVYRRPAVAELETVTPRPTADRLASLRTEAAATNLEQVADSLLGQLARTEA